MADLQEVFRRRRPRERDQFMLPAPTGGLDRRSSLSDMPIQNALELVNLFPDKGVVRTRGGSRLHARIRVTDGFIQDNTPPLLIQPPPAQPLEPGVEFEIPLLAYLAAEFEPLTFSLTRVQSAAGVETDWIRITEHGVLHGFAPVPDFAETYPVELRVRDPSRNSLDFEVTLVVLPKYGELAATAITRLARQEDGSSLLTDAEWRAVTNAERYRVETLQFEPPWVHRATITGTTITLALSGNGWNIRVRPEADGFEPGEWVSAAVINPTN